MIYEEESYIINTLKELKELIRSPSFTRHVKETHENNIMLKQIIKYINVTIAKHNQENDDDFVRNIIANLISNGINFK